MINQQIKEHHHHHPHHQKDQEDLSVVSIKKTGGYKLQPQQDPDEIIVKDKKKLPYAAKLVDQLLSIQSLNPKQKQYMQQKKQQQQYQGKLRDRALGSMYGALMGDAIGSILQFARFSYNQSFITKNCFKFTGGGALCMFPAQITDDGELTLSLARGLIQGGGEFNVFEIVRYYGKWYRSGPFDIGFTTRQALKHAVQLHSRVVQQIHFNTNKSSQSNGCLMRAVPLPIWGHKLSDHDLYKACVEDTMLTHYNKVPHEAVAIYSIAIKYLLLGKTRLEAYWKAREYAFQHTKTVKKWFEEIIDPEKLKEKIVVDHQMGWIKIAFCYSFYFLKLEYSYRQALTEILVLRGDTDTNACIIGGMLGAAEGVSGQEEEILRDFFNEQYVKELKLEKRLVKCKLIGQVWGKQYTDKLLEIAPEKLIIRKSPEDFKEIYQN